MRQSKRIKTLQDQMVVKRENTADNGATSQNKRREESSNVKKWGSSTATGKSRTNGFFVSLPVDIFIQIACYLNPGELLALAKANKSCRNFLMRRASLRLWQKAESNLSQLGLPSCPPHMNEAQYAALLFTKTCTMCGATTSCRADLYLYVRLCTSCRQTELIDIEEFESWVSNLIPCSPIARPQKDRTEITYHCLRDEAFKLDAERANLERSGNIATLEAWDYEKDQIIENRLKHGAKVYCFLRNWEHDEKSRQIMQERQEAIKEQALEWDIPWSEWCDNIHYSVYVLWHTLTDQPKSLTENAWMALLPTVRMILETSGPHSEQAPAQALRRQCSKDLGELLLGAVADPRQLGPLAATLGVGSMPSTSEVSNGMRQLVLTPAPNTKDVLRWDFMGGFCWAMYSKDETEQRFASVTNRFKAKVPEWIEEVEQELAGLVLKGPRAKRANDKVVLTVQGTAETTTHLSAVTRRLLRADCVFKASKTHSLFSMLHGGSNPTVPTPLFYPDLLITRRDEAWNHECFQPYPEASRVAKALLESLETPDAANLELKVMGCRFQCGQCLDGTKMDWSRMIEHYIEKQRHHKYGRSKSSNTKKSSDHDLSELPETPLVRVVPAEEAGELQDLVDIIPPPKRLCGERYYRASFDKNPHDWFYLGDRLTFPSDDGTLVIVD